MIHCEPLVKHHETLKTLWNIMKHSSFYATISALDAETSALDVETSAFEAATSAIARRSFDATISALDAETSALNAKTSALDEETSAIARSSRRYRRWVSGDFGVGITPQMYNRVTNHGDNEIWVLFPNLPADRNKSQEADIAHNISQPNVCEESRCLAILLWLISCILSYLNTAS